MASSTSAFSAATTPLPQSSENKTDSGDGDDTNDVIFADKLPYVIGGVTIACIVVVLVVVVVLCKKARPCKHSNWHVRGSSRKCRAVSLKAFQETNEPSAMWRNRRQQRKRKADPENIHPNAVLAPESHPGGVQRPGSDTSAADTAPDIITAHDSEPGYELADERQPARATPEPAGNPDNIHARVRNMGRPQLPPPLPPKPQALHDPDRTTQSSDTSYSTPLERQTTDVTRGVPVLPSEESLKTALEKLSLQNCSRGPLVCKLTVMGVMEKGHGLVEQPDSDCSAVFLLEPDSSCEPDNLHQHASKRQVKEKVVPESRYDSDEEPKRGRFLPEPTYKHEQLRKKAAVPLYPHRGDGRRILPHHLGRRHSIQIHQPDCPRQVSRRLSESICMVGPNIQSLPTLPSTEDSLSSDHKTDYIRSFSSPDKEPSAHEEKRVGRRLDAMSLKARVQREMQALSCDEDSSSPQADVRRESRQAGFPFRPAVQEEASSSVGVGRPSQNEYFILEPQSDTSDDDISDSGHDQASGPAMPKHRFSIKPAPRTASHPVEADLGRRHLFQPKLPHPTGLPPRPMQRTRVMGHTRSRSETPACKVREGGEGEQKEEEQGPIVVSLKKVRSVETEDRQVLVPAGETPQEGARRPSYRPRISSEPGC